MTLWSILAWLRTAFIWPITSQSYKLRGEAATTIYHTWPSTIQHGILRASTCSGSARNCCGEPPRLCLATAGVVRLYRLNSFCRGLCGGSSRSSPGRDGDCHGGEGGIIRAGRFRPACPGPPCPSTAEGV